MKSAASIYYKQNYQMSRRYRALAPRLPPPAPCSGFTLVESMLAASILIIAIVAMLGGVYGQVFLQTNARNLTLAMNDINRITEQMREENTGCAIPSVAPAGNIANWESWLNLQVRGSSMENVSSLVSVTCQEVGDQDGDSISDEYCGSNQAGVGEWKGSSGVTQFDPIRVSASACWTQMGRTLGECAEEPHYRDVSNWIMGHISLYGQQVAGATAQMYDHNGDGTISLFGDILWAIQRFDPDFEMITFTASDGANSPNNMPGVIESPAMITTYLTCR